MMLGTARKRPPTTGKEAALDDSLGAAVGSVGLLGFGAVVWALASRLAAWQVLVLASLVWVVVSFAVWAVVERTRKASHEVTEQAGQRATHSP